nr:MAG TPA: hypothetical protein [Caudoviricetes sp.]
MVQSHELTLKREETEYITNVIMWDNQVVVLPK